MTDAQTVTLQGEGGSRWEFAVPLAAPYDDQFRRGLLRPADPESAQIMRSFHPETPPEGPEGAQDAGPPDAQALEDLTRAELDARAQSLGIEDPERMPNKGAVIAAIREHEE